VEQSYSPFVKFDLLPLEKVRLVTGARGDIFRFQGTQHINDNALFETRDVTRARRTQGELDPGTVDRYGILRELGTGFHSQ